MPILKRFKFKDFNASVNEKCLEEFCDLNGLTSLIKKPTCFKNPDKPTCIDLILTNQPSSFQHNKVFEIGLSDFHLLAVTEFKMSFQELQPNIINYRDYKNFDNEKFRSDISKMNLNTTDLEGFMKTVFQTLLKENTFVQMKLHLWLRTSIKPLWEDPN